MPDVDFCNFSTKISAYLTASRRILLGKHLVIALFATRGLNKSSPNSLRKRLHKIVVSRLFDTKITCEFIPVISKILKKNN